MTATKRRPGRPAKLTEQAHKALVEALATGCYRQTAAEAAGIGVSTFYRWLEQGEADAEHEHDSPQRELWEAIQKAEADAEVKALQLIRSQAATQWQAAAWLLERKYPKRWARRDITKVEHSGTVNHDILAMPESELRELADAIDGKRA